jgi:hypothetical protein
MISAYMCSDLGPDRAVVSVVWTWPFTSHDLVDFAAMCTPNKIGQWVRIEGDVDARNETSALDRHVGVAFNIRCGILEAG